MVQHEGKLVAFSREKGKVTDTLYFQVQDPQGQVNSASGEARWNGWYQYKFPEAFAKEPGNSREQAERTHAELRLAGFDLLTVKPTMAEPDASETTDPTRVQPADADFAVVSVSPYLYVFRASESGRLYLDRLILATVESESEAKSEAESEQRSKSDGDEKPPATYALKRAYEARYQGTGLRDVPLDEEDRPAFLTKDGRPYYEPTYELPFVSDARQGTFAVCRVPSADPALVMWYVAVAPAEKVNVWAFSETSESVVDFGEWVYGLEIAPLLKVGTTVYAGQVATAPTLAFYAEQDPAKAENGCDVELLRAARLMVAVGANSCDGSTGAPAGPFAASPAMFIYDFPVDNAGRIAPLAWDPNEQGHRYYRLSPALKPADGTYNDGEFEPWDRASYHGTQLKVEDSIITATLLGQVSPQTNPNLRAGDDGLVHLYYGGEEVVGDSPSGLVPGEHRAMVAHFDPRVSRVTVKAKWLQRMKSGQPNGDVQFVARECGPGMQGSAVNVEDVSFGSGTGDAVSPQPDLCTIRFDYPQAETSLPVASETWSGVPRDVARLVRVLNGGASDDAADPQVQDGMRPFFDVGIDEYPQHKWLLRLPLGPKPQDGIDDRPRLTLVTARGDLPLYSAEITEQTDSQGETTATLTLQVCRGPLQPQTAPTDLLTLCYSKLPTAARAWPDILSGQGGYELDSGDVSLFALDTNANIPILLYSKPGKDLSSYEVHVEKAGPKSDMLQLTYGPIGGDGTTIPNLPSAVAEFATSLAEDEAFSELFGISTADLENLENDLTVEVRSSYTANRRLHLGQIAYSLLCPVMPSVPMDASSATTDEAVQYSGLMWRDISKAKQPPRVLGFHAGYTAPDSVAWVENGSYRPSSTPNRLIAEREDPTEASAGAWIRELPHQACSFNQEDAKDTNTSMVVPFFSGARALPRARNLRPQFTWTLETWVRPDVTDVSQEEQALVRRLITYRDKTPVKGGKLVAPQLDYRLGLKQVGDVPEGGEQTAASPSDAPTLALLASVGGSEVIESPAVLRAGQWNHVAMVYRAAGALELNGHGEGAVIREPDMIPEENGFIIGAWIAPDPTGSGGGIISQWQRDDQENQSFCLEIDADGNLVFTVNMVAFSGTGASSAGNNRGEVFRSGVKKVSVKSTGVNLLNEGVKELRAGAFLRKYDSPWRFSSVELSIAIKEGETWERMGSFTENTCDLLRFQSTDCPVWIGRASQSREGSEGDDPDAGWFRGTIGPIRFFNVKSFTHIDAPLDRELLPVAGWFFAEQEGSLAEDSFGGAHATLEASGEPATGLWSSLAEASELLLYANGVPVPTFPYAGDDETDPLPPLAEDEATQLIVGTVPASDSQSGSPLPGLSGQVAQITLWGEARSRQQIAGQARMPLAGDEPNLLAGWNFRATAEGGAVIVDITGAGNDATVDYGPQPSTVPISMEAGLVESIYGSNATDDSRSTNGRIAAGAYVDVQQAGAPQQRAVLRRSYLFNPNKPPAAGGELGAVDLIYVGQVQTDPKLIGIIEGAPPLPSENLTRPYYLGLGSGPYMRYLDTSTVTLRVRDSLSHSLTTSVQHAAGIGFGLDKSIGFKGEIDAIFGAVSVQEGQVSFIGGADFALGATWSYSEGESHDAAWTSSRADTQGTNGDWEPPVDPELNPAGERRFQPSNEGLAVVQSLTADLFAMVFHATGMALGSIVLPNPAIPPDRNLVLFPMNNAHTKQGTLDGRIGLVPDADAARGSYFKPAEAYALAAKVERQHATDQAHLMDVDARHVLRAHSKIQDDVGGHLPVTVEEGPRSGIVDRYVWTAGGGLEVESKSYAGVSSESYQGLFDLSGKTGFSLAGEIFAPFGGFSSYDLTLSYAVKFEAGKSDSTSANVQLDVTAVGEAYLRKYDPDAPGDYGGKGAYLPGDAPGKVRAYRFMSFYLPPDKEHSAKLQNIVDPVWLNLSKSPTARLMREMLRPGNVNPAWRILHRVTYVERVPPVPGQPVYTAEKQKLTPINLSANAGLLDLVNDQLTPDNQTYKDIVNAVYAVLDPVESQDGSILGETVPWWEAFRKRARSGESPDAADQLDALVRQVIRYCSSGYETGVLPFHEEPRSRTLVTFGAAKPRPSRSQISRAPARTKGARTGLSRKSRAPKRGPDTTSLPRPQ